MSDKAQRKARAKRNQDRVDAARRSLKLFMKGLPDPEAQHESLEAELRNAHAVAVLVDPKPELLTIHDIAASMRSEDPAERGTACWVLLAFFDDFGSQAAFDLLQIVSIEIVDILVSKLDRGDTCCEAIVPILLTMSRFSIRAATLLQIPSVEARIYSYFEYLNQTCISSLDSASGLNVKYLRSLHLSISGIVDVTSSNYFTLGKIPLIGFQALYLEMVKPGGLARSMVKIAGVLGNDSNSGALMVEDVGRLLDGIGRVATKLHRCSPKDVRFPAAVIARAIAESSPPEGFFLMAPLVTIVLGDDLSALDGIFTDEPEASESMAPMINKFLKRLDYSTEDNGKRIQNGCSRCDQCLLPDYDFRTELRQPLKKCTGCMVARYCSTDCQTEHWDLHRAHCKALNDLREQNQDMLDNHKLTEAHLVAAAGFLKSAALTIAPVKPFVVSASLLDFAWVESYGQVQADFDIVPGCCYVIMKDIVQRPALNGRVGFVCAGPNVNARFQVSTILLTKIHAFCGGQLQGLSDPENFEETVLLRGTNMERFDLDSFRWGCASC